MTEITIQEKQEMFSIKNRMVQISQNFPQTNKIDICLCGEIETMNHIYSCKSLNTEEEILPYSKIYSGNIGEQITIFKRFQKNMRNREKMKTENLHVIPNGDPLYNSLYSNGFK